MTTLWVVDQSVDFERKLDCFYTPSSHPLPSTMQYDFSSICFWCLFAWVPLCHTNRTSYCSEFVKVLKETPPPKKKKKNPGVLHWRVTFVTLSLRFDHTTLWCCWAAVSVVMIMSIRCAMFSSSQFFLKVNMTLQVRYSTVIQKRIWMTRFEWLNTICNQEFLSYDTKMCKVHVWA